MDYTNNYLQTLVSAADDAHSNLYVARFYGTSGKSNLEGKEESLILRCDGFTPPPTDQAAYPVSFMNQTIERPVAKVSVTRNFSLTFRVDANYVTFKGILDQQGILFNPAKGYTATNIKAFKDAGYLFDVALEVAGGMVDTSPVFTPLFEFDSCWISKITPIAYTSGDSQAATVTITVNYLTLKDIHSGGLTASAPIQTVTE